MSVASAPPGGGAVASAPPGGGAVAAAIAPYWPELDPTTLDGIAQSYQSWGTHLGGAVETSAAVYRPLFNEVLQGQAGDALQTSHDANLNIWNDHKDWYSSAATAVSQAAGMLRDLQRELTEIINYYQGQYDNAIKQHDPDAAQWLADAEAAAYAAARSFAISIYSTLSGKFGTAPAGTSNGNGGGGIETVSYNPGGVQPTSFFPGSGDLGTGGLGSGPGGVSSGSPAGGISGGSPSGTPTGGSGAPVSSGASSGTPVSSGGTSGASGGAPAGSGGTSGASGGTPAGSGGAPAGSGGAPAASSGTPVGSGGAPSASSAPVSSGMVTPISSGFPRSGSGSTTGRGSNQPQGPGTTPAQDGSSLATSGAVPSPMPPATLFGGQTPSGIAPGTGGWAPLTDGGSGADGGGAGSGGVVGGGGMSPAPGQLAPYSPPGAGASPTPPAPAPGAPLGAASAGAAVGGVAPVIAASHAKKSTGAASAKRDNPDLASAQRVLAGLVKACPARPIFWAVSVLRTPVGPQTLIAGSVGGGAYLPPEVHVPSTVQLAVLDPALPSDWAAGWMGWQSPLAILVDHYERLAKVVAGVTVSAMVTSELWPSAPECGADFLAVPHEELVMSTDPALVGEHRLAATDPALAARLTALDRGGDSSVFVAAQLTRAAWTVGAQPDDTGMPIAVKEDADILGLVAEGAAGHETWDNYRREVERRGDGAVTMPEMHAPRDADDSPGSVTARMWYRHYYATGRIAEMVTCWERQPASILDIAYCGVAAGFGEVIATVVTELEKQLANPPGPEGGAR